MLSTSKFNPVTVEEENKGAVLLHRLVKKHPYLSSKPSREEIEKWGTDVMNVPKMTQLDLLAELRKRKVDKTLKASRAHDLAVVRGLERALPKAMRFTENTDTLKDEATIGNTLDTIKNKLTFSLSQYFEAVIYEYNALASKPKEKRTEEESGRFEDLKHILVSITPPTGFKTEPHHETFQSKINAGEPLKDPALIQYAKQLQLADKLNKLIKAYNGTEARDRGTLSDKIKSILCASTQGTELFGETIQIERFRTTYLDINEKLSQKIMAAVSGLHAEGFVIQSNVKRETDDLDAKSVEAALLIAKADETFHQVVLTNLDMAFTRAHDGAYLQDLGKLRQKIDTNYTTNIKDFLNPYVQAFPKTGALALNHLNINNVADFTTRNPLLGKDKDGNNYTLEKLYEDYNEAHGLRWRGKLSLPTACPPTDAEQITNLRKVMIWNLEQQMNKRIHVAFKDIDVSNYPDMLKYMEFKKDVAKDFFTATEELIKPRKSDDPMPSEPDFDEFNDGSDRLFQQIQNKIYPNVPVNPDFSLYERLKQNLIQDYKENKSDLISAWQKVKQSKVAVTKEQLVDSIYKDAVRTRTMSGTQSLMDAINREYITDLQFVKRSAREEIARRSDFAMEAEAKVHSILHEPEKLLPELTRRYQHLVDYPVNRALWEGIYQEMYGELPTPNQYGEYSQITSARISVLKRALLECANPDNPRNFWEILIQQNLGSKKTEPKETEEEYKTRIKDETERKYQISRKETINTIIEEYFLTVEYIDDKTKIDLGGLNKILEKFTFGDAETLEDKVLEYLTEVEAKDTNNGLANLEAALIYAGNKFFSPQLNLVHPISVPNKERVIKKVVEVVREEGVLDYLRKVEAKDTNNGLANLEAALIYAGNKFFSPQLNLVHPISVPNKERVIKEVVAIAKGELNLTQLVNSNIDYENLLSEINQLKQTKAALVNVATDKNSAINFAKEYIIKKALEGEEQEGLSDKTDKEIFEFALKKFLEIEEDYVDDTHLGQILKKLDEMITNDLVDKENQKNIKRNELNQSLKKEFAEKMSPSIDALEWVEMGFNNDNAKRKAVDDILSHSDVANFDVDKAHLTTLLFDLQSIPDSIAEKLDELIFKEKYKQMVDSKKSWGGLKETEESKTLAEAIKNEKQARLNLIKECLLRAFQNGKLDEFSANFSQQFTGSDLTQIDTMGTALLFKDHVDGVAGLNSALASARNHHASMVKSVLTVGTEQRKIADSLFKQELDVDYRTDREKRQEKQSEGLSIDLGSDFMHKNLPKPFEAYETFTRNTTIAGRLLDTNTNELTGIYTRTKTPKGHEVHSLELRPQKKGEDEKKWIKNVGEVLEAYLKRSGFSGSPVLYLELNPRNESHKKLASVILAFNKAYDTGFTISGFTHYQKDQKAYNTAFMEFSKQKGERLERAVNNMIPEISTVADEEVLKDLGSISSSSYTKIG